MTGETLEGTPFDGCDTILVLGQCGIGFELALLLPGADVAAPEAQDQGRVATLDAARAVPRSAPPRPHHLQQPLLSKLRVAPRAARSASR